MNTEIINCDFCDNTCEILEGDAFHLHDIVVNEEYNLTALECCYDKYKEEIRKKLNEKDNLLQRIESLEAQLEELKNNNGG